MKNELQEQIKVLEEWFDELTTPQPIKVDSPHYKRRNAISDSLRALKTMKWIDKLDTNCYCDMGCSCGASCRREMKEEIRGKIQFL